MKNSLVTFSAASVLVISLIIIGTFKTGIVAALTATTTDTTSTTSDTSTAAISSTSASSTPPATDASSTSVVPPAQTQAPAQSQAQSQPSGGKPTLKLVHVVGTKYIDYFTDGTKIYSFPGDPALDSNLNMPNVPVPSHEGLTWVSTKSMEAYDTSSGDLGPGTYAQEADGSYISNISAYTYTDATSSVPIAAHMAASKTDPTLPAVAAPASAPVTTTEAPLGSTTTPPAAPETTVIAPAAASSSTSANATSSSQ